MAKFFRTLRGSIYTRALRKMPSELIERIHDNSYSNEEFEKRIIKFRVKLPRLRTIAMMNEKVTTLRKQIISIAYAKIEDDAYMDLFTSSRITGKAIDIRDALIAYRKEQLE